jgi:hypothetical protein
MATTEHSATRVDPSPLALGNWEGQTGMRRRFDLTSIGLWLGGIALGTAGCIVGACMPYSYPVARVVSALWWGIYVGSFGASVGGLLGMCLSRTLAWRRQAPDGTEKEPAPAEVGIRLCPPILTSPANGHRFQIPMSVSVAISRLLTEAAIYTRCPPGTFSTPTAANFSATPSTARSDCDSGKREAARQGMIGRMR